MKRTVFALSAAVLAAVAVYVALPSRQAPGTIVADPEVPEPNATPPAPKKSPPPKPFDAVQSSLPTTESLAKLSTEEIHATPKEIIEASRRIGEIAAAAAKDPSREPEALEFYGKCARREDLPNSVRAHCLHDLRELSKKRGERADESGISDSVLKLEG